MTTNAPNFYTRDELAKILKVSVNTVDRWRKRGIIKGHKMGGLIRFTEEDFIGLELIQKEKEKPWILTYEKGELMQIDNEDRDVFLKAKENNETYAFFKNGSVISTGDVSMVPNPAYNEIHNNH